MTKTLGVVFIRPPGVDLPLRQGTREVGDGQSRRAVGHATGGFVEQILDELQIGFPLIRNESGVLSREAGIVLNGVVQTQVGEIEMAGPVGAVEEVGGELGDEEAEAGGEVVGLADGEIELFEGDVLAVVREDGVVCEGVEHGTGGSGVALLRGEIVGPGEVVARCVRGNDMAGLVGGSEEVEEEEGKVPGEDGDVDKEAGDFIEDAHD